MEQAQSASRFRTKRHHAWHGALVAIASLLLLTALPATAQQLDKDTNESVFKVYAKTKDAYNNPVEGELTVTIFKPTGPGPFPLVIVNHGRGTADERRALKRPRFSAISRYFVRKGFVVAVPLRFGYGDQVNGDPEDGQPCNQSRHDVAFNAAADQILAVVNHMQRLPFVDAGKLVIVGHSVGGFSTLATAALNPKGLIATVNFAGGKGGQPDKARGEPCGSPLLSRLAAKYGATASAKKSLWLYNENDSFFNLTHAAAWHKSFNSEGGQAKLLSLPAHGKDGHNLMLFGADVWQPLLDQYLAEIGFDRPGQLQAPSPSDYAALDDATALPHIALKHSAVADYAKFLNAPEPRAFAIGPFGTWGFGTGDDALSKALAVCQRENGADCKFYAINSKVVWTKH
jgi:dienelactone hydrolase